MTQQSASPSSTLLPSLQEKLQRFAGELTPEEQAQVRPLVQLASAGIAAIDGAEVEGYVHHGTRGLDRPGPNLLPTRGRDKCPAAYRAGWGPAGPAAGTRPRPYGGFSGTRRRRLGS